MGETQTKTTSKRMNRLMLKQFFCKPANTAPGMSLQHTIIAAFLYHEAGFAAHHEGHGKACGWHNHNKQTIKVLQKAHPQACQKKKRPAECDFAST
jgi:hypothetical protein